MTGLGLLDKHCNTWGGFYVKDWERSWSPARGAGNFKYEKRVFPGRSQGLLFFVSIWAWGKGLAEEGRRDAGFSRILYLTHDS